MEAQTLVGRSVFIGMLCASCYRAKFLVFLNNHQLAVTLFITVQQTLGTLLFWVSGIADQLHAHGHGENTASWLGGGLAFLITTTYFQWRVTHLLPTASNVLVLGVQALSAIGNAVALAIFVYRRAYWSRSDSWCVLVMAAFALLVFIIYCRLYRHYTYKANMKHLVAAGWLMALLAIELRGMPRIFQAISLAVNNPMTLKTVLSGLYIAAVRLCAVGLVALKSSSQTARQAWYIELFGNLGSQLLLTLGWLLALR